MPEHSNVWMQQIAWRGNEIAEAWGTLSWAPGEPPALTARELAGYIDHTLLKADATPAMILALCEEAVRHGFASVCVNSSHVARCAEAVSGSRVVVGSVVGFPLGAMMTPAKAREAELAIEAGAQEIDMVLPVGMLKSAEWRAVYDDVAAVVQACHAGGALCKVILETPYLTDAEKAIACLLCVDAGADYVKTATGFGPGGATLADVALLRYVVGPTRGVKAAGGIRTYADAIAMIAAGATRIGTSAGIQILQAAPA